MLSGCAFGLWRFALAVVTLLSWITDRTGAAVDAAGAGARCTIDTDVRARIDAKTAVALGRDAHLVVTGSREPSRHVRTCRAMYTAMFDRILLAFAFIHMLCLATFERYDGDTGVTIQVVVLFAAGCDTFLMGACAG